MQKQFLIALSLFLSTLGFSQGIEFEHGTWKEVLGKAQQTNKPIFVDVYTSWCGPCKEMSKYVFPLEEVGKVYNTNFICYHINAERGDGIEICKRYDVKSYPTYLFIKSDGSLFSRASGSMNAKAFIEVSKKALSDMNDPKPIAVWEKEYLQNKSDTTFIKNYMTKRAELELPNITLFDEYLKLIPEENRNSAIIIQTYWKEADKIKVNSLAFENIQKNRNKFDDELYYEVVRCVSINTINEAIRLKNEKLLIIALSYYDQIAEIDESPQITLLPKGSTLETKEEIYLRYYRETGETDKYLKYATAICNRLMNILPDSLFKKDETNLQLLENLLATDSEFAKNDSYLLIELKSYYATAETFKVSAALNSNAYYVFEKVNDLTVLEEALLWSNRALELTPTNPFWLITNANLKYKLGRKEEAIVIGEQALLYADNEEVEEYEEFKETLRKMKAGEKTWD